MQKRRCCVQRLFCCFAWHLVLCWPRLTKEAKMRLALYQPDIPQNTGTLLRLGACLDLELDIIEPCGFVFSEKALKRAGMDYLDLAKSFVSPGGIRAFGFVNDACQRAVLQF